MKLRLYSAFKNQVISGIVFLLSLLLFFIPLTMQAGQSFNPQLFFLKLFLMSICFIFFFHFLRNLFCPVVQVYEKEIIISKYVRIRVPFNRIKEFVREKGRIKMLYLDGTELKEIVVAVRDQSEDPYAT